MAKGPLRRVVKSMLLEHLVSIFKKKAWNARYWELELECGHTVERDARYRQDVITPISNSASSLRAFDDALPPPKRVHCPICERAERETRT